MNKTISPIDPDDALTDMAVNQKRPRWARQILQNAEEHKASHGADGSIKKNTRPNLFPEGSLIKRESIMIVVVAQYTSIRSIIAITSAMGWKLYQMDVKTTFLNNIVDALLLGIRSMIRHKKIFLGQGKYTIDMLKRFRMLD